MLAHAVQNTDQCSARTVSQAVRALTLKKSKIEKKIDHPGAAGPSQSRSRSAPMGGESC